MTEITRYRGDTAPDKITIKSKSTGLAIDITGFSFKLTVDTEKDPPDDTTKLYELTGVITDAVNGKVEFSPSEIQSDQEPNTYYFDIEMTDAALKILTIEKDKYKYSQDISK